jgi:hypothetical protein
MTAYFYPCNPIQLYSKHPFVIALDFDFYKSFALAYSLNRLDGCVKAIVSAWLYSRLDNRWDSMTMKG